MVRSPSNPGKARGPAHTSGTNPAAAIEGHDGDWVSVQTVDGLLGPPAGNAARDWRPCTGAALPGQPANRLHRPRHRSGIHGVAFDVGLQQLMVAGIRLDRDHALSICAASCLERIPANIRAHVHEYPRLALFEAGWKRGQVRLVGLSPQDNRAPDNVPEGHPEFQSGGHACSAKGLRRSSGYFNEPSRSTDAPHRSCPLVCDLMVPEIGIEPTTYALRMRRSTN